MLRVFGKTRHPAVDRDKKNAEIRTAESRIGLYQSTGKRGVGWEELESKGKVLFFPLADAREPGTQNHSCQVPLICVWRRIPAGITHVALIWRMSSESFNKQGSSGSWSVLRNHAGLGVCPDSATVQKSDHDQVDSRH